MVKKFWKIKYKNMPWSSVVDGKESEGIGYYEISFKGARYGFISKDAWNDKETGEILKFVETMLNDARSLALKE